MFIFRAVQCLINSILYSIRVSIFEPLLLWLEAPTECASSLARHCQIRVAERLVDLGNVPLVQLHQNEHVDAALHDNHIRKKTGPLGVVRSAAFR